MVGLGERRSDHVPGAATEHEKEDCVSCPLAFRRFETRTVPAALMARNPPGHPDRGSLHARGRVGAYNNFWMDRGTQTIGTRRTSLIVDPNGRMPSTTPAGQRLADARRGYRAAHPADSWVDFSSGVRCILGFNAGPPMTPSAYNNNMQLFQTPDHDVLVTELVHTARIVPLDAGPGLNQDIRQWSGDSRGC